MFGLFARLFKVIELSDGILHNFDVSNPFVATPCDEAAMHEATRLGSWQVALEGAVVAVLDLRQGPAESVRSGVVRAGKTTDIAAVSAPWHG